MRKEIFNVGLTICAIAPLLVGCGANNAGGTVEIPMNCPGNGQVLTTDSSGQFQCVSLPPGVVSIPKCDPNFDALTTDGSTLSCDSRNNETSQTSAAITQLKDVEQKVIDYGTTITMLGSGGMGAKAFFQGETAATTLYNGTFAANGATGMRNAAAICAAQFGTGAHMCTVYEMYQSVVYAGGPAGDKFNPAANLPQAWVYMEGQNSYSPFTTTTKNEPNAGLTDNCASGQYGTADQGWKGTVVSWEALQYNNQMALKFTSGAGVPCSATFPIACCK